MTRKIVSVVIAVVMFLFVHAYSFAGVESPGVELDGKALQEAAVIDEDGVYLPLRAISEALGYKIGWLDKEKSVSLTRAGDSILIDLKNYEITANGHSYYMSGDYSGLTGNEGKIVAGRTYMGAGFFSSNLGFDVRYDKQAGKVVLTSVKQNEISIETVKEASEDKELKLTLQYPKISGMTDSAVQDDINASFKKAAEAAKEEGLKNAADLADYTAQYPGNPNKCETYFSYEVKYNRNGLLSIILSDYQYSGGAHGITVQSSDTIDLKTGKVYGIKDLFKDGADYTSIINASVRSQIDERVKGGLLAEFPDGLFKSVKNDQDFFLSDAGIVIYFQQYEYFPYAAGIQQFAIDVSSLKAMLKPEFSFLNGEPGPAETEPVGESAPFYAGKVAYAAENGL